MYQSIYDWSVVGYPGFSEFLEKLYQNSYSKEKKKSVERFLHNLENYFYELIRMGFVNTRNFYPIIHRLELIQKIDVLPKELCRHYALTKGNTISINPMIKGKNGLSTSSFQLMIDAHEIGHIVNHGWEKDAKDFCNSLGSIDKVNELLNNLGLSSKHLFYGFQLLDEVCTQEVAERITYQTICKPRPKMTKRKDKIIFNFKPYVTNYSIYGEFQSFAEGFARNLDFLNCKDDDSLDVLGKLSMASLEPNFIKKVEYEMYHTPDKVYPFIMMLAIMGKVKESTYQFIGLDSSNQDYSVNEYVSYFSKFSHPTVQSYTYQKK